MELNLKKSFFILLYLIGLIVLHYYVYKEEFPSIFLAYTFTFIGYIFILKNEFKLSHLLLLGLVARGISIFSFPHLSDDIYRFIWDGLQWVQGATPFQYLPSEQANPTYYEAMLINRMNSPDYYSVYPPILQLIFYLVAKWISSPLIIQVFIFKMIVIIIEGLGIWACIKTLKHWNLSVKRVGYYILNPLVIIELLGNLHFEGIMIAFLSIMIYFFSVSKYSLMSLFMSLAILTKLTPIIIFPMLNKYVSKRIFFLSSIMIGIIVLIAFSAMLIGDFEHFFQSINLYFQKFEFNASIYFLLRWIGFQLTGYNQIYLVGPFLAICSTLLILWLSFRTKRFTGMLYYPFYSAIALTIYYLCSTTIHPWYITTILFLSLFTNLRYPIIWSYLVIISYSHYNNNGNLYYYLIFMEYFILGIAIIWDIKKPRLKQTRL